MTQAQRARLVALFTSAKQHNLSAAEVHRQLGAFLTPAEHRALMAFINAASVEGNQPGGTRESNPREKRWTA